MHIQVLPDIELRMQQKTSLNRLCDISEWEVGGALSKIMAELGEGAYVHRKSWEYALCIYGLRMLEATRPAARAIATGAGYERPLFYFANTIQEMVATDIYEDPEREGNPAMLTTPELFAPFDYRRDRLTVRRMNAIQLDYEPDTFDFAFSLSSIEHYGSRANSHQAMVEMQRVVKPGGIVCVATELILNGTSHHEYFSPEQLQQVVIETPGLKLIGGDPDLRISRSLVENPIELDVETNLHISPHIVLKSGDVVWTSVMLFLQKL